MITTDAVVGSPCWIDLGAPDVRAAVEFYGTVFGWEFEELDEDGEYGVFRIDGRRVAGIGPLTEENARSAWMIYFSTTDADAAARTVRELGGTVRREPFDVDGRARLAQFTDPLGAEFAVWQAGTDRGLEVVDEPGALNWIELYTSHVAAAKEFYFELFGWSMEDMPLPGSGGAYALLTPARGNQEHTHGGMMQVSSEYLDLAEGLPYWHPVFAVRECDATVSRVTSHGGGIQLGPENAENVGRMAVCLDRSGADFVVLESTNE
ncbi:VOC family protein [Actinopolyspora mortivallis]|uniref:Hydroxylase n=1 Tax=Actinopolyspora mortivallis TaxID=33906 RepID=A0A2T0GY76_ACTMO|nr:VOC family protein [Actinopolyspora mortivallis]PRW64050.1 hydroxylase [Actinopolyspora mortivallis]